MSFPPALRPEQLLLLELDAVFELKLNACPRAQLKDRLFRGGSLGRRLAQAALGLRYGFVK